MDHMSELNPGVAPLETQTFQERVDLWLAACFGEQRSRDTVERNHRFLEEALELVQSCGCSQSEAHQLVDYTFSRERGDKVQEAGGTIVTLAALCLAQQIDMHTAGECELQRDWENIEKIRAKADAKPKHSPLPWTAQTATPSPTCNCGAAGDASARFHYSYCPLSRGVPSTPVETPASKGEETPPDDSEVKAYLCAEHGRVDCLQCRQSTETTVQAATPVETASPDNRSKEERALYSRIALKIGEARGILLSREELRIVYGWESQLTQARAELERVKAERTELWRCHAAAEASKMNQCPAVPSCDGGNNCPYHVAQTVTPVETAPQDSPSLGFNSIGDGEAPAFNTGADKPVSVPEPPPGTSEACQPMAVGKPRRGNYVFDAAQESLGTQVHQAILLLTGPVTARQQGHAIKILGDAKPEIDKVESQLTQVREELAQMKGNSQ